MKRSTFLILSLAAVLTLFCLLTTIFLLTTTQAQTTTHRIAMWVVGGGGASSSSTYTLSGVGGQSNAATPPAQGSTHRVEGGFWMGNSGAPNLYLPIVAQQPPPIPTDTPTPPPTATPTATPTQGPMVWQRMGLNGAQISSLAIQGNTLFAADRRGIGQGGGLYRRSLAGCNSNETWTTIPTINFSVHDVDFQNNLGVAAAFTENGIFYSKDGGITWTQTTSSLGKPTTVKFVSGNIVYTGTDQNGIYRSENGGETWTPQSDNPQLINDIALNGATLWIGVNAVTEGEEGVIKDASKAGAWILTIGSSTPVQMVNGLAEDGSRQVWDFYFRTETEIYIATYNGVFRGNGSSWTPFDLQGRQLRSLENFRDFLYTGERIPGKNVNAGVWRRSFASGSWEPVPSGNWSNSYAIRDLLAEPNHCQGLLAATEDGVWVYRQSQ